MRRSFIRRLTDSLLACVVAAGGALAGPLAAPTSPGPTPAPRAGPPGAPELIRVSRNEPGDAKPISMAADEVYTWDEGGQTAVFLRGRVLVQQGVLQARFEQGVAWVDRDRYRRTGIWRVELYAEGKVSLDSSSDVKTGPRAFLDVATRGEVRVHAHRERVQKRPLADDPLVRRGRAERASSPPLPTAGNRPLPAMPGPGLQRTSHEEPAAPGAAPKPTDYVEPPPSYLQTVPVAPPAAAPPGSPPATLGPPQAPRARGQIPDDPPAVPPLVVPAPTVPSPPGAAAPGPRTPAAPPGRPGSGPAARAPAGPAAADAPPRQFTAVPRKSTGFTVNTKTLPDGKQAYIITGGLVLRVLNAPGVGLVDIEADQVVVWMKGNDTRGFISGLQSPEGSFGKNLEFYLKGNVEIRRAYQREVQTIHADEVYYDVDRNVALALSATFELREGPAPGKAPVITEPVFFRADEFQQLAVNQFHMLRTEIFSSKLPSDPGLKVYVAEATVEEKTVPRLSPFGRPIVNRQTGAEESQTQDIVKARTVFAELEGVPFLYFPYLSGDARDPLGPIEEVNFGYSRIFGTQLGTTLNVYDLLGLQAYENTKWKLNIDYLSKRGVGVGTDFDYSSKDFFGLPAKQHEGFVRLYGIYDDNFDLLGPIYRPMDNFHPPDFRGRATFRDNAYDLPAGFQVQTQVWASSDRNFLEEYYKREFDSEINQSTYLYVKQQQGSWAWTGLVEGRLENWQNVGESLPRLDGYLLGRTFFDRVVSNSWVSLGYQRFRHTSDPEPPVSPTDAVSDDTGRFHVQQELSLPFSVGPFKLAPYVDGALTEYTHDLEGEERGRAWGGFGLRGSIPFTRLYPDVHSELWNLDGINHKIVVSANYFYAQSTDPHTRFPQIDRLNDYPTDQALRDILPLQPMLNPAHGTTLATSPLFDPQLFAISRQLFNRIDTLDSTEVLEGDIRQRLQTKRGYPGAEHIVDWMTLDVFGAWYPPGVKDNLGGDFSYFGYDYVWNIGDRTAFTSNGWFEPVDEGARVFTLGLFMNRPDRTNFYLGYRQIEPVQSRAVTAAVTYIFSPKYGLTASAVYDFGINQSLSNNLILTRIGSDLQVSVGISYNALTSSVGAIVEVVPNLVPANRRTGSVVSSSLVGR